MSLETHNFRFLDFELDPHEKVLFRDGEPVAITPKAFLLLQTLVENQGHILEKEQLMAAVWAGSFVEDGNLTFTVNQLRKALGDDRLAPRFVETVPRRGYRFISDVTRTSKRNAESGKVSRIDVPPPTIAEKPRPRLRRLYMAVAALLITFLMVSGLWYAGNNGGENVPLLSEPFALEKISADGNVLHAVVSRDGQNAVYTSGFKGKQSVWLRQLAASNNIQIVPPADYFYYGLALSPDGDWLYFTRRPKLVEGQGDIYRVSVFGGVPQKIVTEVQGPISISPDGQQISYIRCYYRADDNCSLFVATSDGANERRLVTRPRPVRIGDNEFSPGGRSITFTVGQSENQASEFGLAEVDLESGAEREVTSQKFFNIKSIAWMPDESGVLISASRVPDKTFHIWRIKPGGGEAERLTKDGGDYAALSIDAAASMLIATQIRQNFRLQVSQVDAPEQVRVLADATSVSWAPDGNIIFSSPRTGNHEIWSISPDGNNQRQLTNNVAEDRVTAVSPNNNFIFFESNRSGETQVWRMNMDGSNQTQITRSEGGFPLYVSRDGAWLYYSSALGRKLKRVPTNGGDEELVLDKGGSMFAISPDGSRAAMTEKKGDAVNLLTLSLDDNKTVTSFPLPPDINSWVDLSWSGDGRNIAFITRNSEMQNNRLWLQPLTGGPPQHVADLGDEEVFELSGFAMSPDGRSFALAIGRWEHDAVLLKGFR